MPEARPLKDLLSTVLQQATAQQQRATQLQRQWSAAVGRELAARTKVVGLRKGRLTVQVENPGASFALSLEAPRVLKRLREHVHEPIEELVVRPGATR